MDEMNKATVHPHPTSEEQALRERLRKARAGKAASELERSERAEESALQEEVEDAEREARDVLAILKAESEYGAKRIAVCTTPMGCVIVRRPHAVTFKRFQDKGDAKNADCETLVRKCLAHPDAAGFDRIVEEYPGIVVTAANAVVELAGINAREVSGK